MRKSVRRPTTTTAPTFWNPVKLNSNLGQSKSKSKSKIFNNFNIKPVSFQFGLNNGQKNSKLKTVSFLPTEIQRKNKNKKEMGGMGLRMVSFLPASAKSSKKKGMNWEQAKTKFSGLNPYGDADRDGVPNIADCRPFDKKKHLIIKGSRGPAREEVLGFFARNPSARKILDKSPATEKEAILLIKDAYPSTRSLKNVYAMDRKDEKAPLRINISPNLPLDTYDKKLTELVNAKHFGSVHRPKNEKGEPINILKEEAPSKKYIAPAADQAIIDNSIANTLEGKESAMPRLFLKGKYAGDVLKNLREGKVEQNNDAVQEVEDQSPSQDVIEDMIEDKGEDNYSDIQTPFTGESDDQNRDE